jgi:hypothetical protein
LSTSRRSPSPSLSLSPGLACFTFAAVAEGVSAALSSPPVYERLPYPIVSEESCKLSLYRMLLQSTCVYDLFVRRFVLEI